MTKPLTRQQTKGDKRMSVWGRLFQARIWREYAMAWDGRCTSITGVGRAWVENILRVSRDECLRRSRINAYLARRLNRPTRSAR